jgi:hypothetical protein
VALGAVVTACQGEIAQFIAVCSASTLLEELRSFSLFSSQAREDREAALRCTPLLIDQRHPSTNSDKLSDERHCRHGDSSPDYRPKFHVFTEKADITTTAYERQEKPAQASRQGMSVEPQKGCEGSVCCKKPGRHEDLGVCSEYVCFSRKASMSINNKQL